VMIENIDRFIEEGERPFEAALKGAKQIGFTIISLTVSLVAVLIPLLFMGGIIGRLFREFAVTLSVAIVVSAILSLTLTPMMCAHLLQPKGATHGRLYKASERFFEWMIRSYERALKIVLRHQPLVLAVTIGTLILTGILFWTVPKGFFPLQDTGMLQGVTEAPPDISFPEMMARQEALVDVVRADPDVQDVASFIGSDGTNPTTNSGRLSITLKPRDDRKAGAPEIVRRILRQVTVVQGIDLYLQQVQDLQVDNRVSRTQYQYTLEDADPVELAAWGPKLLDKFKTLPMLQDAASDQQNAGLQASLRIDRDTAARLGVTTQAIDDTLYDAFGQRQISIIFTQLNQYRVILEVKPEFQSNPNALDRIYVRSTSGSQIPLSAFTHYEQTVTPLSINHQGQFPAITLSFNLAPGKALGDAVTAIRQAEVEIGLPSSVHAEFEGTAQAFQDSLKSEPILILAALITVYIVLGVLYESTIHPITILSTLPSAGIGALLALMVTGNEFSIIALIGIVLLIGIVKKNAIMMIDFALEAERVEKLSPEESILKACLLRFRPIMMTTMAALLGGVPLALGTGTGSELRRPLGISIVGGLIISQMLTLFTTPVVYLYMDRLSTWLHHFKAPAAQEPQPEEPSAPA
jgi:multidrug efflux pump